MADNSPVHAPHPDFLRELPTLYARFRRPAPPERNVLMDELYRDEVEGAAHPRVVESRIAVVEITDSGQPIGTLSLSFGRGGVAIERGVVPTELAAWIHFDLSVFGLSLGSLRSTSVAESRGVINASGNATTLEAARVWFDRASVQAAIRHLFG